MIVEGLPGWCSTAGRQIGRCVLPFDAQSGDLIEVAEVARQESLLMREGNGSDLQVRGPDANTIVAKPFELLRSRIVTAHRIV